MKLKPLPRAAYCLESKPVQNLYTLEQVRQIQRDVIEACMKATEYLSIKELLKEIPE